MRRIPAASNMQGDFRAFWCENALPYLAQAPYSEAAAQLVFMAFLQRVVNGGGFIDREYAVGSGRIDLCLRWPYPGGVARWAAELKVWRDFPRTHDLSLLIHKLDGGGIVRDLFRPAL